MLVKFEFLCLKKDYKSKVLTSELYIYFLIPINTSFNDILVWFLFYTWLRPVNQNVAESVGAFSSFGLVWKLSIQLWCGTWSASKVLFVCLWSESKADLPQSCEKVCGFSMDSRTKLPLNPSADLGPSRKRSPALQRITVYIYSRSFCYHGNVYVASGQCRDSNW